MQKWTGSKPEVNWKWTGFKPEGPTSSGHLCPGFLVFLKHLLTIIQPIEVNVTESNLDSSTVMTFNVF